MRLDKVLLVATLFVGLVNASEFIDYKSLAKKLKTQSKKAGTFATAEDVRKALKAKD